MGENGKMKRWKKNRKKKAIEMLRSQNRPGDCLNAKKFKIECKLKNRLIYIRYQQDNAK